MDGPVPSFPLKDYWLAGVTLKWELFSGFKTKGEEKENQAGIARLKAELRKLELSVNKEVQKAFIAVNESHETIRVAKIALTEAEENMALAKGRYGTGLADAIEFSDAETNLTIAKNDLVYRHLRISSKSGPTGICRGRLEKSFFHGGFGLALCSGADFFRISSSLPFG